MFLAVVKQTIKRQNLCSTGYRKCSTQKAIKVKPVNLAYASYEKTQSCDAASPLIISHGIFGSKANWDTASKTFVQKTSPQRKIIATDTRNHGDSPHSEDHTYEHMVEDLRALMTSLKIQRASLLGHAIGGRTNMYFALKYPELVDKLVIVDISPISTSWILKSMPSMFLTLNRVIVPKNVPMASAKLSADLQLSRSINNKGIRSFILTNLVQKNDGSYIWRINVKALMANFKKYHNFPKDISTVFNGPVLFIRGGLSDCIQKKDLPKIMKMFPNAEFRSVEGAGHWVHSEKPTEFLQVCLDFLNRKVEIK